MSPRLRICCGLGTGADESLLGSLSLDVCEVVCVVFGGSMCVKMLGFDEPFQWVLIGIFIRWWVVKVDGTVVG